MRVIRCVTLFYNRIMTIESRYGCILLGWPFGFVFWLLHRLHLLWLRIWVTHNSVQPKLYRCNYSGPAGVFILGRNRLQGIRFRGQGLGFRVQVVVSYCLIQWGLHICCGVAYVSIRNYLIHHIMGYCTFTTQIYYNVHKYQFYYIWRFKNGVLPKCDKSVLECEKSMLQYRKV